MPRKSKATIEDLETIALAKAIAFDPLKPDYIRAKALGTYNAMRQRMERQRAEKADRAAAKRAERDKANYRYPSILPDNGRGPPPGFVPSHVRPFVIPAGINRN
jgi:hypothetical protein